MWGEEREREREREKGISKNLNMVSIDDRLIQK